MDRITSSQRVLQGRSLSLCAELLIANRPSRDGTINQVQPVLLRELGVKGGSKLIKPHGLLLFLVQKMLLFRKKGSI